jgi:hypothetical protein
VNESAAEIWALPAIIHHNDSSSGYHRTGDQQRQQFDINAAAPTSRNTNGRRLTGRIRNTTSYGNSTTISSTLTTSHSRVLTVLSPSTLYHYRVKSKDAAGNLATSGDYTFTTTAAPDTTPPVISAVASSGLSGTGATITWTTNEAADTQVEYGTTTSYGSSTTLNSASARHLASLTD